LFEFVFFIARNIVATRAIYFELAKCKSSTVSLGNPLANKKPDHFTGLKDVMFIDPLPPYACCHAISKIAGNEQLSLVSSSDTV
jgi:hypothetical protein